MKVDEYYFALSPNTHWYDLKKVGSRDLFNYNPKKGLSLQCLENEEIMFTYRTRNNKSFVEEIDNLTPVPFFI